MPELPEVELARRYVHRSAVGRRIQRAEVLDRRMMDGDDRDLASTLGGRKITGTARHGKHLFLELDRGALRIHLGMSGSLTFIGPDETTPHQRLRLEMGDACLVLDDPRRFGRFQAVRDVPSFVKERGLGPDALSITEDELLTRAGGRRKAIKAVLLDQAVMAGVGNLYADEVLFQEKIAPWAIARDMDPSDLSGIWRRSGEVLNASIAAEGDLSMLPDGYLLRVRKKGGVCPRCGDALASIIVGGRNSFYCPSCQS